MRRTLMLPLCRLALVCIVSLLAALLLVNIARAVSAQAAASSAPRAFAAAPHTAVQASAAITTFADQLMCRFGFAQTLGPLTSYDPATLAQLRTGWYQNFNAVPAPARPNGIEYAQTVRVHQNKVPPGSYDSPYVVPYSYTIRPSLSAIADIARANRGALWLVGNEMDRRDWACGNPGDICGQDEILPEVYADAYHDIYSAIKNADASAQVANGGLVLITPLRFKYLDRVWNAYLARYGTFMPVDVWNIHPYVLQEVRGDWGADIPPGFTETVGVQYLIRDHDRLDLFIQQIVQFRQWMVSKGEVNKPLIVGEYGVLFHDGTWTENDGVSTTTFTRERVRAFMYNTFDYMLSAKDATLGYAPDDNRLVQRWNWFSLDWYPWYFNGTLISYTTGALLPLGADWIAYVSDTARPLGPALNLKMLGVAFTLGPRGPSGTQTATVRIDLSNSGFLNWTTPVTVQLATDAQVLAQTTLDGVKGCGGTRTVELTVSVPTVPVLWLTATVDPQQQLPDADRSDNTQRLVIIQDLYRTYLPLVER